MGFFMDADTRRAFDKYVKKAKVKNKSKEMCTALNRYLKITRVTDQRTEFLQLLEQHQLMPGRRAVVENRDELAETVQVRPHGGEPLRLGFQAASRILVGRN